MHGRTHRRRRLAAMPVDQPAPPPRRRWRPARSCALLAFVVAVVAAVLIVTVFTVDLGPALRARAESEGSKFISSVRCTSAAVRPAHARRLRGRGSRDRRADADRSPVPAREAIEVSVPWWTLFSRRSDLDSIEMTDWDMVVEPFPNGRHNFPSSPASRTTRARSASPRRSVRRARRAGSSPTTITGHRGAPSRATSTCRSPPASNSTAATRSFSNGDGHDPGLRTVPAPTCDAVQDQRRQGPIDRMDLIGDGARSIGHRRRRSRRTGRNSSTRSRRRSTSRRRRHLLPQRQVHGVGHGDFTGTFHLFKRRTASSRARSRARWRASTPGAFRICAARCCGCRIDSRSPTRRRGSTAAPRGSITAMAPLGSADARARALGRRLQGRRSRAAHRLPRDRRAFVSPAAQPAATARLAARQVVGRSAAKGEVIAEAPAGAALMTRAVPAALAAERGPAAGGGPVQPARAARLRAGRRRDRLRARSRMDHARTELGGDAEDLRRVRGTDGVRRAVAHSVSRHQPRLAGERSRARRHHDRVRRADRCRADRRLRRVRRRDARGVHAAAHRRARSPAIACAPGTWSGAAARATLVIENSYVFVRARR